MSDPIKLTLIAAQDRNGVIGQGGQLPWRLRDDLIWFKQITHRSCVIMGRNTWDSLPRRPLPNRINWVVTRNPNLTVEGATVSGDLLTAISAARGVAARAAQDQIFVIGGAELYAAAMPHADRIYLTQVDAEVMGDAHMPAIDWSQWRSTLLASVRASAGNDHAFVITQLDRQQPSLPSA